MCALPHAECERERGALLLEADAAIFRPPTLSGREPAIEVLGARDARSIGRCGFHPSTINASSHGGVPLGRCRGGRHGPVAGVEGGGIGQR